MSWIKSEFISDSSSENSSLKMNPENWIWEMKSESITDIEFNNLFEVKQNSSTPIIEASVLPISPITPVPESIITKFLNLVKKFLILFALLTIASIFSVYYVFSSSDGSPNVFTSASNSITSFFDGVFQIKEKISSILPVISFGVSQQNSLSPSEMNASFESNNIESYLSDILDSWLAWGWGGVWVWWNDTDAWIDGIINSIISGTEINSDTITNLLGNNGLSSNNTGWINNINNLTNKVNWIQKIMASISWSEENKTKALDFLKLYVLQELKNNLQNGNWKIGSWNIDVWSLLWMLWNWGFGSGISLSWANISIWWENISMENISNLLNTLNITNPSSKSIIENRNFTENWGLTKEEEHIANWGGGVLEGMIWGISEVGSGSIWGLVLNSSGVINNSWFINNWSIDLTKILTEITQKLEEKDKEIQKYPWLITSTGVMLNSITSSTGYKNYKSALDKKYTDIILEETLNQ